MRISNELQIGKAGEYIVCADLILKGFIAYPSEQGLPYDIVLDRGDKLLRVQVKTCEKPRILYQRKSETYAYQFNIKRHGKNNKHLYEDDDIDIFALVALDTRTVAYISDTETKTTMNFRADSYRGKYYDEKGIKTYELAIKLHNQNPNMTQTAIAKEIGVHVSLVNRFLQEGYKPFVSEARYFSDFYREPEWFKRI